MSNSQQLIPFAFGAVIVLLAANLLAGTRRPATPSRIILAADAVIRGARYWVRNSGTSALRTACRAVSPSRCLKMRAREVEPRTIRSASPWWAHSSR